MLLIGAPEGASDVLRLGSNRWFPRMLFARGERGAWYDPGDLSTLYQDHAGTIPALPGSPVGLMLDKSGNGNHLTQPTLSARPTLHADERVSLYADGVDDHLSRQIDLSGGRKVSAVLGLRKVDDLTRAVYEFAATSVDVNVGSFCLRTAPPTGAAPNRSYYAGPRGAQSWDGSNHATINDAAVRGPKTGVVTSLFDLDGPLARIRYNAQPGITSSAAPQTGSFGDHALYLFRRGAAGSPIPFTGHFYGMILLDRLLTADELAKAERWMAGKTGVTL